MKKELTKVSNELYHYDKKRKEGRGAGLIGDCTGLRGDCTGLSGNCTGLKGDCSVLIGDCSGLIGDCTGLKGDCTGLIGDLNKCKITDEDRDKGISIKDLVK